MAESASACGRRTRWTFVACLALLFVNPSLSAAQSQFSGIVVFGTSLSDPGNAFVLLGDQTTPPYSGLDAFLIPSAPYAKGGHHFSNGATWVEQFARSIGLADSVRPALATPDTTVTNFAVGAARASQPGPYNFTGQVDLFLARSQGVASPQNLYAIEMGINDVRDAVGVYLSGGDGSLIVTAALSGISANIQRLYVAGARDFIIWSSPNVSLTPAARMLGPVAGFVGLQVTQNFNDGLTAVLGQLSAVLPGVRFARLDAFQLLNAVFFSPQAFGLSNVTTACVTPNDPPFTCKQPDTYLFWDGIHPTKAGHAILAQGAAAALQ